MEKHAEKMNIFKKNNTNDMENVQKEVKNMHNDIENIQMELKKVDLKYMNWLEEKEMWIKELKDKISKKIDYINKKEDELDVKTVLKNKMMSKLMPKERRTLTEQEKKDLNIA